MRNARISISHKVLYHDPQHPTLHLNLYLLHSFAALISTYSAFSLISGVLLHANRPLAQTGRRAVYLFSPPPKSLSTTNPPTPHLWSQYLFFFLKIGADLEPLDWSLSCCLSLSSSQLDIPTAPAIWYQASYLEVISSIFPDWSYSLHSQSTHLTTAR